MQLKVNYVFPLEAPIHDLKGGTEVNIIEGSLQRWQRRRLQGSPPPMDSLNERLHMEQFPLRETQKLPGQLLHMGQMEKKKKYCTKWVGKAETRSGHKRHCSPVPYNPSFSRSVKCLDSSFTAPTLRLPCEGQVPKTPTSTSQKGLHPRDP